MRIAIVCAAALGLLGVPALAQEGPAKEASDPKKEPKDGAAEKPRLLALGQKVDPTIELKDIDGNRCSTKDFAGRITVVNFWATRCPWMKGWDPTLAALQREYEEKGVTFLMIESNEANGELRDEDLEEGQKPYQEIRRHLEKNDLPYTVLVDHGSVVADKFGAKTTPDVFLFDAKGRLVYRGLIDDDPKREKGDKAKHHLRDALDTLLGKGEMEPAETKPMGCGIKRPADGKRAKRGRGDG